MTLRIVVNGTDFTAKWRPYESRWTQRGWQGESAQSEFIFDDPNEILHADFATRKIVEVWEDASGSDVCMYRGRIANKGLGMGPSQVHPDMRWTLFCEDYNKDLEGIRIENAVRPDETDEVRVESIRTAFLNGAASTHASKRPSTELGNTYLGGGTALNMLAETYTDTSPMDMLNRIVELTGRVFFVTLNDDGTGELYYGDTDDMSFASDIALTDRGEADGADGIDLFAVYKSEQAGDHAGQNVITGGAIRYGDGSYYEESNIGGAAATYDKWEETYFIDDIPNDTVAEQFLHHIISKRDETNTYFATIDMRAQDAHRIRAGMMVDILRKRANRNTTGQARAVVVTHEPVAPDANGDAQYRVTMEIGRPQFTRVGPRVRRRIPRPTQPTTPGGDVETGRLYYTDQTDVTSGLDGSDHSASWTSDGIGSEPLRRLRNAPQNTLANSGSGIGGWNGTNIAATTIVDNMFSCLLSESAAILATVQNGGTWRTVIRSKNRTGIGINLAAQENYPEWTIRIYRPGTGFIGTVLDVGDATAIYRFDVTSAWPSIPMSGTGAAVPSAVGTDYLVVDIGADHVGPVTGGTGSFYRPADSSATDLPYVVDSVADQNSWLEGSTSGPGGGTVGDGRDDLIGTERHCYKRCDDTEHFDSSLLADGPRPPTVNDDVSQGFRVGTHWLDPDTARVWWITDNSAGAAEWVLFADLSAGTPGTALTIEEEDGDPTGVFATLKVPNGRLTDNGDGSASVDFAASVHAHGTPSAGFRGVLVRRTSDFTSTNTNDSVPDFDDELYDTDGFWTVSDPDRITIPAAMDGLMMQFYATGLWATGTDNYVELKMYRNVTRPIDDGGSDEGSLIGVAQLPPATAYNTQPILVTPPVQVATGDEIYVTFRTPASETVVDYFDVSLLFGGWLVGGGSGSSLIVREVGGSDIEDVTELEFDASDFVVTDEGGGVVSVALTSPGGGAVPTGVLLESGHAVPFTFDEILQESDGSDFLWASE